MCWRALSCRCSWRIEGAAPTGVARGRHSATLRAMSEHSRTLILTGASRGIGHATVKRFSDEGWRIITCSRENVPADCKRDPNWTHHIVADLADDGSLDRFISEANQLVGNGSLHALVNNAAISPKTTFKERLG